MSVIRRLRVADGIRTIKRRNLEWLITSVLGFPIRDLDKDGKPFGSYDVTAYTSHRPTRRTEVVEASVRVGEDTFQVKIRPINKGASAEWKCSHCGKDILCPHVARVAFSNLKRSLEPQEPAEIVTTLRHTYDGEDWITHVLGWAD